jgi:hypothetical protein
MRVAFALAVGSLGGILALRARVSAPPWFGLRALPALAGEAGAEAKLRGGAARGILVSLAWGAGFLALGAAADFAFKRHLLGAAVSFAYGSPALSFLPEFFAARNVGNPFFLLAMRIAALLTSFGAYAALALVLRPRGLVRYVAYLAAWALLLGLSAFTSL